MTETEAEFILEDTLIDEAEARARVAGRRITLGGRTMEPKAQIVAEFSRSVRVPGYFPPLPELRRQLRTLVDLLDEPAPALPRKEDLAVPGPAGPVAARLYGPETPGHDPLPVVAYFHGGGWVQGDLETHDGLAARLALWSGAMVVAFDYRLAPEHPFPGGLEDCAAAYRWLREHGGEVGADPGRVAVAGDSAGGNLSAVVSQGAAAAGLPPPDFQVLIYPAVDMALDSPSHAALADAAIIPRDRIVWYMEQYLRSDADKGDVRASPLCAADLSGQPPALVLSAGFDPLRDEARAYADRLTEAGVDVVYHEYPGQIHAFLSLARAIPDGLRATREIADYVRRRFAAGREDG